MRAGKGGAICASGRRTCLSFLSSMTCVCLARTSDQRNGRTVSLGLEMDPEDPGGGDKLITSSLRGDGDHAFKIPKYTGMPSGSNQARRRTTGYSLRNSVGDCDSTSGPPRPSTGQPSSRSRSITRRTQYWKVLRSLVSKYGRLCQRPQRRRELALRTARTRRD